jgi:hypothetical protein
MKYILSYCLLLFMMMTLAGCELVGDIFSAGVYTGIFIVILVVVVIIWLVTRMGKRG